MYMYMYNQFTIIYMYMESPIKDPLRKGQLGVPTQ